MRVVKLTGSILMSFILMSVVVAQDTTQDVGSGILLLMPIVLFIAAFACLIFWIQMLVDAIKHQEKDKALWIIIILLGNTIGAIIYYFAAKKPRIETERNLQSQPTDLPPAPLLEKGFD